MKSIGLKPTWPKVLTCLILTAFFILYVKGQFAQQECLCVQEMDQCTDYHYLSLITFKNGCHCDCVTMQMILYQYLIFMILPFLVIYLLYSMLQPLLSKIKIDDK